MSRRKTIPRRENAIVFLKCLLHKQQKLCREIVASVQLTQISTTRSAILQKLHYLSAAAICFARGMNDTPKLVALLLAAKITSITPSVWVVAAAMALGGWFNARKVATTMAKKIVPLTETQGVTANLVTAFLVIFASKLGLPVSTTHVSVGSISGVGLASGKIDLAELSKILMSWVITLPCAATIAALTMWLVSSLGKSA